MTTKDYTEFAFTLPDLIEIQRASFRWFLEAGLIERTRQLLPDYRLHGQAGTPLHGQRLQTQAPEIRRGRSKTAGQHLLRANVRPHPPD